MRQDLDIQWREEKRTITTLKPKVIERRVQVMTTRVLQKGEIDPETGEECCEQRQVRVPVETQKCGHLWVGNQNDVATVTTVATVRSTTVNILFLTPTNNAVAALTAGTAVRG